MLEQQKIYQPHNQLFSLGVAKVQIQDALFAFSDPKRNLQLTIADARNVIADVNSGQGTVGRLMHDPTLYNETTASMTNLKEILQKINQGQGTVGKVVNDQDFYKNAKLTLQKLDKMTDSLEDQGPLSVVGTVVGNLF